MNDNSATTLEFLRMILAVIAIALAVASPFMVISAVRADRRDKEERDREAARFRERL